MLCQTSGSLLQFIVSAMLMQVNPLAETKDGKLIAADAKLGFDDNAAYRQKELFSQRDTSQEDPRYILHDVFSHVTIIHFTKAIMTCLQALRFLGFCVPLCCNSGWSSLEQQWRCKFYKEF